MAEEKINNYLQHTLRDDFTSPNPDVRKGAIYALGRLGTGPEVLLILRNLAAEDEDPEVRYTAKKALNYWEGVLAESSEEDRRPLDITWPTGKLHTTKLADALASPRPGQQISAIIEAVKLGDPAALGPLRTLLESEQDPWVVSMAVKALGSLGEAEEIDVVTEVLAHPNHRVVANAIEALEMLGDPHLGAKVAPFLDSEDNRVRANAIKALHPFDADRAFAELRRMARNHRPWMRASAIYCLKVLDDHRCEPLLQEMLEAEFAADLTKQLLEAAVAQGTRSTVGLLGWLAEATEDGARAQSMRTAHDLLLRKLQVPLDEARALVEARRKESEAHEGHRSGMFRVGDLDDEDEPSSSPVRPRKPDSVGRPMEDQGAGPGPGYGTVSTQAMVATEDPGSRQALGVALALALLAAGYGIARLTAGSTPAPEPAPAATRAPPPFPDEIR